MNTFLTVFASVQIDVDITVVIQFVTFTVALFSIWGLIITPYLKAREAREEKTQGSREGADEMEQTSQMRLKEYDDRMLEIRRDAMNLREKYRAEGEEEQNKILDQARAEIMQKTQAEQQNIAAKVQEAELAMEFRSKELAELVVHKILPLA